MFVETIQDAATEKTCLDSKSVTIKNCLRTQKQHKPRVLPNSKSITKSNVVNCYNSTTDGNSEIACLGPAEKGSGLTI